MEALIPPLTNAWLALSLQRAAAALPGSQFHVEAGLLHGRHMQEGALAPLS